MSNRLFLAFTSCSGLLLLMSCEAFGQAAQEPVVVEHFQRASEAVASGDMGTAAIATISGVGALLTAGVAKWLHGRMKESPQGKILA